MTASAPAVRHMGAEPGAVTAAIRRVETWLADNLRFRLYDDVLAIVLVGGMLATVGWSVQLAHWGNSPFIHATMLVAGVAGFLFARWRFHWVVGHLVGFAGGFAVVFWQAAHRANGDNLVARARDAWERYFQWLEAARTGGISTDLLPFTVMLLTVAWIVSYFASWTVFRWRSPWAATVLMGTALLINLSYRPDRFEYTLFVFMGVAMLLFAHLAQANREQRWRTSGTRFPQGTRRLNVQDGIFLTAVVVMIASFSPLIEPRSQALTNSVGIMLHSPAMKLEEPTKRLLSGIQGRPRVLVQDFASSLPFMGAIHLADTPVMTVETPYPVINAGHVYDTYASTGWSNGTNLELTVPVGSQIPAAENPAEQFLVEQKISPAFNIVTAVPANGTVSADHPLRLRVLAPMEWTLGPAAEPLGADAPSVLKELAVSLERSPIVRRRGLTVETLARQRLPGGFDLVSITDNNGFLQTLTVTRSGPPALDPIAVDLPEGVLGGESYVVVRRISTATDEQLDAAGETYPQWVTDRYLQLPATLPDRIGQLGDLIVAGAGAVTPFEKTSAIASYLRDFSYSQGIRGPLPDQDPVDYFLFDTWDEPCPPPDPIKPTGCQDDKPKGYSQYFGSAMTILLRTQGIPARMIAGYALGTYDQAEGDFLVRDVDRHGWSQAYFPGYGWIDVEATPGYPLYPRGAALDEVVQGNIAANIPTSEFEEGFREDLSEFEALARLQAQRNIQFVPEEKSDGRIYWAAGSVCGLVGLVLLLAVAWNYGMGSLAPSERGYRKLSRLGWIAGIGRRTGQTSIEYGRMVDFLLPGNEGAAGRLIHRYNERIYGRAHAADADGDDSEDLWRRLRGQLVRRALARLWPG